MFKRLMVMIVVMLLALMGKMASATEVSEMYVTFPVVVKSGSCVLDKTGNYAVELLTYTSTAKTISIYNQWRKIRVMADTKQEGTGTVHFFLDNVEIPIKPYPGIIVIEEEKGRKGGFLSFVIGMGISYILMN